MKAIVATKPGEAEVLELAEVPAPPLVAGALRIRVAATAVNRADLLQIGRASCRERVSYSV